MLPTSENFPQDRPRPSYPVPPPTAGPGSHTPHCPTPCSVSEPSPSSPSQFTAESFLKNASSKNVYPCPCLSCRSPCPGPQRHLPPPPWPLQISRLPCFLTPQPQPGCHVATCAVISSLQCPRTLWDPRRVRPLSPASKPPPRLLFPVFHSHPSLISLPNRYDWKMRGRSVCSKYAPLSARLHSLHTQSFWLRHRGPQEMQKPTVPGHVFGFYWISTLSLN